MTRFGKYLERTARDLVEEAVEAALRDAEVAPEEVQAAYVGNAVGGLISGQESIRAQVVLRRTGLSGIPMVNVENACASSSTAFHLAWQAVAAGSCDRALAIGYEKLHHTDKQRSLRAFDASMDLQELTERFGDDPHRDHSVFVDLYASLADAHPGPLLEPEVLALVSVKNHHHGALNPYAQYREEVTVDQVLGSRRVAGPLTVMMCSPVSDGAASLLLTADPVGPGGRRNIMVAASVLASGRADNATLPSATSRAARVAFERAGLDVDEVDVIELHDATAWAELELYGDLGLCAPEEAPRLVRDGTTWLGGRLPVNPSGGLLSRGHPIGATGCAQLVELTWQLLRRCGSRQVEGARVGLAQNSGGWVGSDAAAAAVHILLRS